MYSSNAKIKQALTALGYSEIVMFPHTRFSKDVYNWDGVCKKHVHSSSIFEVYWVQCKTGWCSKKEKERLKNFCFLSGQKGILAEVVPSAKVRKNGRQVRITVFGDKKENRVM